MQGMKTHQDSDLDVDEMESYGQRWPMKNDSCESLGYVFGTCIPEVESSGEGSPSHRQFLTACAGHPAGALLAGRIARVWRVISVLSVTPSFAAGSPAPVLVGFSLVLVLLR